MKNILFLTKGQAEDLVAQKIAKQLHSQAEIFFHQPDKEVQITFDLVIVLGDLISIIRAVNTKAPFIYIGVNKSSYSRPYNFIEKGLLQAFARKVFVKDRLTEIELKTHGIRIPAAEYAGNPIMDCLPPDFVRQKSLSPRLITIGFLSKSNYNFDKISRQILKLQNHRDLEIRFISAKEPAKVLAEADLVIGLSPIENEQAAGLGIPVISFYGWDVPLSRRTAEEQKKLLGEANSLIRDDDPIQIAAEVWYLLRKPEKMKIMGRIGTERVGEAGAIPKITDYIIKTLNP